MNGAAVLIRDAARDVAVALNNNPVDIAGDDATVGDATS